MDKKYDEPQYIDVDRISPEGIQAKDLKEEIKKLCDSQPFAVFATPVNTTKYDFIVEQENVSVLVDDRSLQQDRINEISALTIVGKGKILSKEEEILKWSEQLTKKHPNLKTFVEAKTTSIVLIEVVRHLYVNKFQQMREWDPN